MTKQMKAMPYAIKQKLRQIDKYNHKVMALHQEVADMIEEHEVPYDHLTAQADVFSNEPKTEALAFVHNCEGNIEENIKEIEEVFLYFANKR
ncbi:hypothetical protein ACIGIJ_18635 [Bacillus paranthracis]|uniref:hypothetical protein n=1 Tax=Bacillus paranthracis TaxID=2026186 RepID=UPI0037C6649D